MPFYIFTRIEGSLALWDLVEEAASRALAHKAMIDYRMLSEEHGDVEVMAVEAESAGAAKAKLLDVPSSDLLDYRDEAG